jgi:type I restriction-modification system DNA methylase subunit
MASKTTAYLRSGKEIVSGIQKLAYRHPAYQIFQDWLEISAIAISNSVDLANFEDREKRYIEIINQYNKEEQQSLVELFATLIMTLTKEVETGGSPRDVLGEVFHGLELHNKYKGQFFTPNHICEFMGQAVIAGDTEKVINENGYVSVCEPCVGSGGLVIGLASAMASHKYNYQTEMCVTACDIDIKCVHMAYLQLSLYGIPAKIIHGNSLTGEQWSVWYTPTYIVGLWALRESMTIKDVARAIENKKDDINPQEIEIQQELTELKVGEDGQIRLF